MDKAAAQREAVRLAKERLGEATSGEMAAYIREAFGLTIQPFIVGVLLGTLREREELERTNRAVRERLEAWKAENPEEAKKLAATAKRKESARRRKAEAEAAARLAPDRPDASLPIPLEAASVADGAEAVSPADTAIPAEATEAQAGRMVSASLPTLG